MHKLIKGITFFKYFHRLIVLTIDVVFTTISTLLVCILISYISHQINLQNTLLITGLSTFFSLIFFLFFKTYTNIIRFALMKDVGRILFAVFLKSLTIFFVLETQNLFSDKICLAFLCIDFMLTSVMLIIIRYFMISLYDLLLEINRKGNKKILIYGINEKSLSIINRLLHSDNYTIAGFITFEKQYNQVRLNGYTVYSTSNETEFIKITQNLHITGLVFATEAEVQAEQERLVLYCKSNDIKAYITPSVSELDKIPNEQAQVGIREIKIEDLLGRSEININLDEIIKNIKGKTVLVTGAAGSIGSELCRQLANLNIEKLILFDSAETPMHNLRLELEKKYPFLQFVPIVGDIRIMQRIEMVFRRYTPQFIFHAAAYKHVPLMEENPCEAVVTNVIGTRNVADLAVAYGVEKMIMVSTDKAVNPTNVMGASKRLAEIYVQSLGLAIENKEVNGITRFITTRFGNVLGSNGSVIPRFREQIEKMQPVTVTHPEITRYFMTIPEACRLVMEAAIMGHGNEIFIFDMGAPIKIVNLAEQMIRLAGYTPGKEISIEYTGLRPGEKLYEELLNNEENTLPTPNKKIRIAQVRHYSYSAIENEIYLLGEVALAAEIDNTVRKMKALVPEFKSKNSPFERLDKELKKPIYV